MTTPNQDWKTTAKADTPEGIRVWTYAERYKHRRNWRYFSTRNGIWNKAIVPGSKNHRFNAYSRVGKMMEVADLAKVNGWAYNEFANHYLTNVRDWDTVRAQAMEWWQWCEDNGHSVSKDEALAEHIIHILDETWDGIEREQLAEINITRITGKTVIRPTYEWDVDYAIDLALGDEDAPDGFVVGYQIKPASFFRSRNEGVIRAHMANAKKHQAAEAKGKQVFFIDAEDLNEKGTLNPIHWSQLTHVAQAA